jgi:hypothetical protein
MFVASELTMLAEKIQQILRHLVAVLSPGGEFANFGI